MPTTIELEHAKEGSDFRLLARDVNKLIPGINALMNMTMLLEGKSRGVGQLEMRGDRSFLRMFTTPGGFGPTIPVTVQVTSSKNPATAGDTISFTATIVPNISVSIAATGTVQFQIDGSNFGSPVALVNGVATSSTTSSLSTGTHTVQASYSGNDDFFPATGSLTETILIATSVSVTSNPSSPGVGQSVTFTATITPSAATGTVQFQKDGTNIGAAVNVSAGHATSISTTLTAGSHTIAAIYSGDSTYAGSTGTLSISAQVFPTNFSVEIDFSGAYNGPTVTVNGTPQQVFTYKVTATGGNTNYSGEVYLRVVGGVVDVYYGAQFGPRSHCQSTPSATFYSSLILTNGVGQVNVLVQACALPNYNYADSAPGYILFNLTDPGTGNASTIDNGGQFGGSSNTLYVATI